MIQTEKLKAVLSEIGFVKVTIGDYYQKDYGTYIVAVDFNNKKIIYHDVKGFSSRNLWYTKQWSSSIVVIPNVWKNCTWCRNSISQSHTPTYQGIKISDKLPSIEALQERIKL